jgi:hypothetical protein
LNFWAFVVMIYGIFVVGGLIVGLVKRSPDEQRQLPGDPDD